MRHTKRIYALLPSISKMFGIALFLIRHEEASKVEYAKSMPEDLSVSISMGLLHTWVKGISLLVSYLPNENHQNFRLDITMELRL